VVAAKRTQVAQLRAQLEGRMNKLEAEEEDPEELAKARQAFQEVMHASSQVPAVTVHRPIRRRACRAVVHKLV
jgi:hypothetical protein